MCDKKCSGDCVREAFANGPCGVFVEEPQAPTHFQRVARLNEIFGNPAGDPMKPDWEKLSLQLNLLQEEMAELSEAHEDRDIQQIRDGLCDVMVVANGYYHLLGLCADDDMLKVHESNMSKICRTRQELEATVKYWSYTIGLEVYEGGEPGAWWVKSKYDQRANNGKPYPAHKFLKCINFHEPRFAPVVRQLEPGEVILKGDLVQVDGKPDQYIEYSGLYGVPVSEHRRPFFRRAPAQTCPVQGVTVVSPAGIPADLVCEGDEHGQA